MKNFKCIIMALVIFSLTFSLAYAANPKVQLNGNNLDFTDEQGNKVEAQLINNRTMVPLRKIFESLGCSIDWNQETKTVIAKLNNKTIKLTIGSNDAFLSNGSNEEKIVLDSAPVIIENRTLVPLRFIAESLGCDVGWDQANQTAIIIDYEEIAKLIEGKSKYIYNYAGKAEDVAIIRKYFDEWDASRNTIFSLGIAATGKDVYLKFDGTSSLIDEIKNEEWNEFTYTRNERENNVFLRSDNYVFSSMFNAKKGTEFKYEPETIGLSKKHSTSLKEWIQLVTKLDNSNININTYKGIKADWQKFANTFFNGSKTLKANDFAYTYINLEKIASTRTNCVGLNTILLLNKIFFKLNLNYQDLLYDYPTITYNFSEQNSNGIKISVTLKSSYKETIQYEYTMLTKNI